uniref:NADH-ubiquinone oxidoreductase chain 2 n=1 Tax=Argas sp. SpringbokSA-QMS95171 TaxID=1442167 RepID=W0FDC6_9ACAR|nr:NADH dehydrogenase subunit 2 [Argas sp. SpringbokSA-QMS95171]
MINMILFWNLTISIFMALSSSSFFSLWICLEINMMMFIPLMNSKNVLSSSSMILYFISQSLASTIFITFFFMSLINPYSNFPSTLFMMSAILMKLGAAPFHFWFPEVAEGLSYYPFSLLMTIQKIIPLYMTMLMNNLMLIISILMSAFIGSLGGFNQTSLRKLLAFSSIAHMAWMISLIISSSIWWTVYFLIYVMMILMIIHFCLKMNISFVTQINTINQIKMKLYFIILLMSLGGLPPFLGFFIKMMSIKTIINFIPVILLFLISSSLLNLFFYTRIIYPQLLKMYHKNIFILTKKKSLIMFPIQFLSLYIIIPMML